MEAKVSAFSDDGTRGHYIAGDGRENYCLAQKYHKREGKKEDGELSERSVGSCKKGGSESKKETQIYLEIPQKYVSKLQEIKAQGEG